jgi:hypothetical protein
MLIILSLIQRESIVFILRFYAKKLAIDSARICTVLYIVYNPLYGEMMKPPVQYLGFHLGTGCAVRNLLATWQGLSCEDCAPGYTRSGRGYYLGTCVPCSCSGKSTSCDPETGVCLVSPGPSCATCCDFYVLYICEGVPACPSSL